LCPPKAVVIGRLHAIGRAIITVYANDHLPPHFHIVYPDFEVLIEIETFAVYAGSVPSQGKKALTRARENIESIKVEWNRINKFRVT
jgi:hypothetical protein